MKTNLIKNICMLLSWAILSIYMLPSYAEWDDTNAKNLTLTINQGSMLQVSKNTGSIFVADPNIVDFHLKSPGILYLYTKKLGTTSLYVSDRQGKVIFKYTIRVTQNLTELKSLLQAVAPGTNISVMATGSNIILKGAVKSAAQAQDIKSLTEKYTGDPKKVLTFLHVSSPTQVNLRVQFIEMSREVVRSLGINWAGQFSTPNTQISINPLFMPTDFAQQGTAGVIVNATKFQGLLNRGNFSISGLVNVLEQNGLVTILSEPNLTALSGETASFLVGGEFPIPVPQGVTGAVTIVFKKFGVSLAFVPTILENGKINLQVRPEVSQLSDQGAVNISGFQVPALSTRRAQTTVELRSGQSFAIAGLLQNNANKLVNQLPGLGDLPILGALFRSERFKRSETELVIIVTPYLVQAAANEGFLYPTDDANTPINRSYSIPSLYKNVGFILD